MRLVRKHAKRGSGFANLLKQITDPLAERFEQTKKTVNALFNLTDYNKAVRDVLAKYGDMPITEIKICRNPVSTGVKTALNIVSLGAFKQRLERQPYDDIYHLFALITVQDGTVLTLDKQAQITLKVGSKAYKDSVNVPPPFTTLNTMLSNTKQEMGTDAFFGYNAKTNNCQGFLWNFLKSNGKTSPELRAFVMQDVNQLFDKDLESFSKFITDLGSKVSTLQFGGRVLKKSC
jgi:hypothetical protein